MAFNMNSIPGFKGATRKLLRSNDRYWAARLPHQWFQSFDAGGIARFVQLPPHGDDGHPSFVDNSLACLANRPPRTVPAAFSPQLKNGLLRGGHRVPKSNQLDSNRIWKLSIGPGAQDISKQR